MSLNNVVIAIAAAAMMSGCAQNIGSRIADHQKRIAVAREKGAMQCAPVALALAEAHTVFSQAELDEGDVLRARREIRDGEDALREVEAKVAAGNCIAKEIDPSNPDRDGDGIVNAIDGCPDEPEDLDGVDDDDGCPDFDDQDSDGDGIANKIDACPKEKEDADGFQDDDGCPDKDNDGDGIADGLDNCPNDAEDADGIDDDDGCPDCDDDKDGVPECPKALDKCPGQAGPPPDGCPLKYNLVVVTKDKIELKQTVYFDTNKTKIKRVSFALLDEVALALKDNPSIVVRIEGHTDSQGSDAKNMKLSQGRADAIRIYLMGKGIAAERMTSVGFGETQPIADNRYPAGRAQNRRVEFVITSR